MAIRSFGEKAVEEFYFSGRPPKKVGWTGIAPVAKRKLDMIRYAVHLRDLLSPPSNRLEALKGALKGYHSIRINDQWRVVFRWTSAGAEEIRIVDYH